MARGQGKRNKVEATGEDDALAPLLDQASEKIAKTAVDEGVPVLVDTIADSVAGKFKAAMSDPDGNTDSLTTSQKVSNLVQAIPSMINKEKLAGLAVDLKDATLNSPKVFQILTLVFCSLVIINGFFSSIFSILTFSPIELINEAYQVVLGSVCLAAEIARVTPKYHLRTYIKTWCRFLEKCFGRGILQFFVATLPLSHGSRNGLGTGLGLLFIAVINIIYGYAAARKLENCLSEMQKSMQTDEDVTPQMKMAMMRKKFEAMDMNDDGQISLHEMKYAVNELNFEMSEWEMDAAFQALAGNKGHIDIADFERWWVLNKGDEESGLPHVV